MNLKPYPTPTYLQRLKIAAHYLLPQLALTQAAGWLAERRWGALTHAFIRVFARQYHIDFAEAALSRPEDYASFNDFFIRELKPDARTVVPEADALALPADGRVSECGNISQGLLLQAKGHLFSLEALLGGDTQLVAQLNGGSFLTTYLSPQDYHRVHMPCDGVLRRMIYVPGELFSVNPFLAEHIPNLFARNERVICVFDTAFGVMVQILVGATITASISTVWAGIINPPRSREVRVWDYPAEGEKRVALSKGAEMGAFRLGSTVVNLFPAQAITLAPQLVPGAVTRMGALLGTLNHTL